MFRTSFIPGILRRSVAVAAATVLIAAPLSAQLAPAPASASSPEPTMASVPFAVGEELVYRAKFGVLSAGSARMRVEGIDTVRGRRAYHVVFTVDGGILFFRVHDRYESWIDVETLSSLRHEQHIAEGGYHRTTVYEIFPDRQEYSRNDGPPQASVANPLDDGSFIYAIRAAGIRVGETRSDDRYFVPDRNPVVLTGVREDTVAVGAGTFATTVVRPRIKTGGIFSENGQAEVWFSDDERRIPVQVKTRFSKFSLTLSLASVTYGDRHVGMSGSR